MWYPRLRVRWNGSSVADPDPGWVRNRYPDPGSGMNIFDHISENLEQYFWVKIFKFSNADPKP